MGDLATKARATEGRAQMRTEEWKRYVRTMCHDAWDLDAPAVRGAIRSLEALIAADRVSDSAVAEALLRVGVSEFAAELAATSIRAAMVRSVPRRMSQT